MLAVMGEPFTCPVCGDEFSRQEHLTRHQRCHNAERPFPCKMCGKRFGRRDTLARHEKGHEGDPGFGDRASVPRIDRACTNCSKSKIRCDGDQPCKYCASRNLDCYRELRRKRKRRVHELIPPAPSVLTPPAREKDEVFASWVTQDGGDLIVSQPHASSPTLFLSAECGEALTQPPNLVSPLPPLSPQSGDPTESFNSEPSNAEPSWQNDGIGSIQFAHEITLPNGVPEAIMDPGSLDISFLNPQFNITDWMSWDLADLQLPLGTFHALDPIQGSANQLQTSVSEVQVRKVVEEAAPPPFNSQEGDVAEDATVTAAHGCPGTTCSVDEVLRSSKSHHSGNREAKATLISFPELTTSDIDILQLENFGHVEPLSEEAYKCLVDGITEACTGSNAAERVDISLFPSKQVLDCFIQLYFEYFHPLFPVIHQPSFSPPTSHWVELLAVAAAGCRYSKATQSSICAYASSELLRISISYIIQAERTSIRTLWLTKAMILSQISMMYSGDRRLLEMGLATGNVVTTQCRRNNYLKGDILNIDAIEPTSSAELDKMWLTWVREETSRRVGYGSWILQCQLPLHFDLPSSMSMSEMLRPLPCPDGLWEAPNPEAWYPLYLNYRKETGNQLLTLKTLLQSLIDGHTILHLIGDFGHLALIHAIYHTTFELRSQLANPLIQHLSSISHATSSESRFSTWQTKASVLIELLISKADTTTRAPLLTPFLQPQSLTWRSMHNVLTTAHHVSLLSITPICDLLVCLGSTADTAERVQAKSALRAWAEQDSGRTARRAVLHGSLIFTLVRLHSCRGFHEPISLLVATLTLWVYNHFTARTGADISVPGIEIQPVTVRLDQVWTKEAGRVWVEGKAGTVRGYLTDVGNVNEVGAGTRLLDAACGFLLGMPTWGLSSGFAKFLLSLKAKGQVGETGI